MKYSIFKDPDFKEVFAALVEMRRKENDFSYPIFKKAKRKQAKKQAKKQRKNNDEKY